MAKLTDRAKTFREAIAGFIEARRMTKEKGKNYDPKKYEYGTWLADAASRAQNLRAVTHPVKFSHSSIKGASSVRFAFDKEMNRTEVGTHSLTQGVEEDFAISDAKHLDVHSFLKEDVAGRRVIDWIRDGDPDFILALSDDLTVASEMAGSFLRVMDEDSRIKSSPLAKQVYWLYGEEPADDGKYHLLQPMFSSSLEHEVHRQIQEARTAAFEARRTKKQNPIHADHHTYPDLVARTLGGSNAQNVSPLNTSRGGVNYLLPSLPPARWKKQGPNLLERSSMLEVFLWFEDTRDQTRRLANYLKSVQDQSSNKQIRDMRDAMTDNIVERLAMFGVAIRGNHPAGWTRSEDCRLPRCEQLWLDPERTELPLRDDSEHPEWRADDEAFNTEYNLGNWADEVATRFGNWLNAQLREAGLVTMAMPERNHWARQVIIDVAWPAPMQRHATATEETA